MSDGVKLLIVCNLGLLAVVIGIAAAAWLGYG
jgi:hypothetical protein